MPLTFLYAISGGLVLLMFLLQVFFILKKQAAPQYIVYGMYFSYVVALLSAVYFMFSLPTELPHWLVACGVLFFVAISSSMKANKPQASFAQKKMGLFVASIAYAGMIGLIVMQPNSIVLPT